MRQPCGSLVRAEEPENDPDDVVIRFRHRQDVHDEQGRLANRMIPGKIMPGNGGVMDPVSGAKRVISALTHTAEGEPNIVPACTLPPTLLRPVSPIVTQMAVIEPAEVLSMQVAA